jgi:hypothetical protein
MKEQAGKMITFRKKIYRDLETLQEDLDVFLEHYNKERTHQGKRCQGRTPMQTFLDARELAYEKRLAICEWTCNRRPLVDT